jgi:HTH-type transcriptional regulator, competence development regulator
MNLATRLKQLRKESGLSLRQLERKIGISNAYLCQLENKTHDQPNVYFIQKLAQFYGLTIEELINER